MSITLSGPSAAHDTPCRLDLHDGVAPAVLDDLGCGVIGRDQAGEIRYVNERILSWTGHLRDELVGRSLSCLIPPELDEILHSELDSVDGGDLRARLTIMRRKDSTTFPVLALPQHNRHSDPDAVHCAVVVDLAAMQTGSPRTSRERRACATACSASAASSRCWCCWPMRSTPSRRSWTTPAWSRCPRASGRCSATCCEACA